MSDTGSQATVRFDVASTGLSRLAPARMAGNLGVVFVPAGEGRRFGQAVWIAQEERRSARNGAEAVTTHRVRFRPDPITPFDQIQSGKNKQEEIYRKSKA